MKLYQRILLKIGLSLPNKFRVMCFLGTGMKIGHNTVITGGFYVDRPEGVRIGENCFLNHFVHMHNGIDKNIIIDIKNNVFIGPEAKLICASHKIGDSNKRAGENIYGSIIIEDGAWIGGGTIILPGVKIAKGTVVGAGSIVTKSTEPNSLYLGIPAKKIRDLD